MPRRRKDAKNSDEENDVTGRKVSKQHHPIQRNAANERERSRMRVLSKAFSKLKTTLPWVPSDTKLSKLDTLRLASSYIAHLKQILDGNDEEVSCNKSAIHPLSLTWPFSFQGKVDNNGVHHHIDGIKSDKDSSSGISEEHSFDDITSSP